MTKAQRIRSWISFLLFILAFPASIVLADKTNDAAGGVLLFGMIGLAAVFSPERPKHQAPIVDLRHRKKNQEREKG